METLHGFDFFALQFDGGGKLLSRDAWAELQSRATSAGASDVIFLAHGFRNDEQEARSLYTEFLRNFRRHMQERAELQQLTTRTFIVAGVFWPSKAFREAFGKDAGGVQSADTQEAELEDARQRLNDLQDAVTSEADRSRLRAAAALLPALGGEPAKQDEFVDLVLSIVHDAQADPTEGLEQVKAQQGSELLDKLRFPIVQATAPAPDADGGASAIGFAPMRDGDPVVDAGGVQGIGSVFGSIFGRVGQFLNLTTWYLMKERAGTVGANGVAQCVRDLKDARPAVKVHLAGHSLGGRLMAACAKSLAQPPVVRVESLVLLQAAFSHFGLSADNREGVPGFFRDVLEKQVVTGPMVATFSFEDEVVGKAYAIASRLAGDNVKAVGDRSDPFGGIGRNGAQNLKDGEFAEETLHTAGAVYAFPPRIVHCLDGSGGLIVNHGDVRNPNVTYAFASALAQT